MNTTAVDAIATKYRNDLEGRADIYPFLSLYLEEIRDKDQLSTLCFPMIVMAEILSGALKDDHCKSLLRLIVSLTDGAGRPKIRK